MATKLQVEIASKLKELGSQKAVVELGYNKGTVSKVAKKLKGGWKPEVVETSENGNLETTPPTTQNGRSITVGKITIKPENWSLNQYGAILILDTYNKAKRDIGYEGTIGDFICDIFEFSRRILNYKEVEYLGASEGRGSTEEDGSR